MLLKLTTDWGDALFNLKNYEEAITKYQEVIKLNLDYVAEAYNRLGRCVI